MREFSLVKKGYEREEVNKFILELEEKLELKEQLIDSLKRELDVFHQQDKEMKQKSENIAIALTAAVEKAKQIEKSSYNVYNLKIQELDLLYNRWEKVLNELVDKYPKLDEVDNVKRLMAEFRNAIKTSVKDDFRFINTQNTTHSSDPMRVLLSKMNASTEKNLDSGKKVKPQIRERRQLPKDMQTKTSDLNKLEEKSILKPIYSVKLEEGEQYDSLLDKFLTQDATVDSAYANKIANKGKDDKNDDGFNLKDAVNPKQDLEEIMKSFDFFNGENN